MLFLHKTFINGIDRLTISLYTDLAGKLIHRIFAPAKAEYRTPTAKIET
jgi:hypothetical protein